AHFRIGLLARGETRIGERILPAEIIPVVYRHAERDDRGILGEFADDLVGGRTGRAALRGEQLHHRARIGGMSRSDDRDNRANAKRTRPARNRMMGHHRCHTATAAFRVSTGSTRPKSNEAALVIGRPIFSRYSLRSEPAITSSLMPLSSCREFAQHIMQDAAVPVVVELVERIDTAQQRYMLQRAIAGDDLGRELLARLQIALQAADRDLLVALEPDRRPRGAFLEGQRQHAHADEVGAMDALEALADHGAYAEQPRTLGGPVAR